MNDLYSYIKANDLTVDYRASGNIRGLYEALISFAIYFSTLIGSYWAYQHHNFSLLIPLIIFNALSIVRLYTLAHDCGHGSLVTSETLNTWIGRLTSLITWTPFGAWSWSHLHHHKIVNNVENRVIKKLERRDVGYLLFYTVSEYHKKTKTNQLLYKLIYNPIISYMIMAPIYFIIIARFPVSMDGQTETEEEYKKNRHSVLLTNLSLFIYYAFYVYFFGIPFLITVYLISTILAITFGVWLFKVQHIFPETKFFSIRDKNDVSSIFQSTSLYNLPSLLNWFSFSIGYHHVHHLWPMIPGYNLKKCYLENPILQAVTVVTLWDTLKIMRLRLYDDINLHRVISWKEYYQQHTKAYHDQFEN